MKELFSTTITKPPEVIVNKFFFVSVSVSFFFFSCSKGQAVGVYQYISYFKNLMWYCSTYTLVWKLLAMSKVSTKAACVQWHPPVALDKVASTALVYSLCVQRQRIYETFHHTVTHRAQRLLICMGAWHPHNFETVMYMTHKWFEIVSTIFPPPWKRLTPTVSNF